jgi:hypothetical protein
MSFHAEALLEAVYTAAGIDKLLFARKERMALGANFNTLFRFSGTCLERFTADATHCGLAVLRMNILFHFDFTSLAL